MLTLGILILVVFTGISVFLIFKGVRLGDAVDQYQTSGKMYIGLAVVAMIFAIGFSIFCFVKNSEINSSNNYNYGSYDSQYDSYDKDKNTGTSSTGSFTNKYGSRTTKCAISGCTNYIARSGYTNCCTTHSNKCGNCRCYIDSDAMYCMSCISGAITGNKSSSGHECYVCGDKAYSKYGSYYYCSDCLALVKAFSD